jgi:hypothetical protein
MKEYLEKILLYIVPFLIAISICYNNGYWSLYPINIYEYYQVTDILKAVAMPAFSFISLAFFPLLIAGVVLSLSFNLSKVTTPNDETKSTYVPPFVEKIFSKIDKLQFLKSKLFYVPVFILLLLLISYLLIKSIYSMWILLIDLSPYSDDKQFIEIYFNVADKGFIRSIEACIVVPFTIAMAAFLLYLPNSSPSQPIKAASKTFFFTLSIIIVLTLSYNAGRIDAYKIIAGYDFYFIIDSKNEPHKYLGRLDKYFFFLDDNKIIKSEKSMRKLNEMPYSTRLSIISEDSLKALQLHRYNPSIIIGDSNYYKAFQIRGLTKPR